MKVKPFYEEHKRLNGNNAVSYSTFVYRCSNWPIERAISKKKGECYGKNKLVKKYTRYQFRDKYYPNISYDVICKKIKNSYKFYEEFMKRKEEFESKQ